MGITGSVDNIFVLKKFAREGNTATFYASGRDIEYRHLTLRFENCVWNMIPDETSEETPTPVPEFVLKVAEFVKGRKMWQGTATELLAEMKEENVKPNVATKHLSRYYHEILLPQGIEYKTSRNMHRRTLEFVVSADKEVREKEAI